MSKFKIYDWAGNVIKFKGRPHLYDSFDDAEALNALEDKISETAESLKRFIK
jgi:hypothetical protein